MKKLVALFLVLIMSLSLVACAAPAAEEAPAAEAATEAATEAPAEGTAEPTKMTLILRGGTYGEVVKAVLPAFEAEHNVTCEVLDLSFDELHSKIALDAVNAKGAYDYYYYLNDGWYDNGTTDGAFKPGWCDQNGMIAGEDGADADGVLGYDAL